MASFVRDYEQAAKGTEDETVWATKPDWEPLRVHENQGWRYIKKDRNGSAFHHIALKCRINYFCNLQLIKELLLCHWEIFQQINNYISFNALKVCIWWFWGCSKEHRKWAVGCLVAPESPDMLKESRKMKAYQRHTGAHWKGLPWPKAGTTRATKSIM